MMEIDGFPQRLQRLRKRRQGLSRSTLSELCGLHRDAIRRYERGEAKPTFEAVLAIAEYFEQAYGSTNVLDYLAGRK